MTSPSNINRLYDLSGLVAVVTGGGTGIGLMMACALESNGAKVYITGRRKTVLEEAAKKAEHAKIIPIVGDVNSKEDMQRAVDYITKDAGHIDLLVNNAGLTSAEPNPQRPRPSSSATVAELRDYYFNYRDDQDWRNVLNTNIAAVFTTSMAFLELLDEGNKIRSKDLPTSQIINIGSTGGLTRDLHQFIYNASKAGVHHLTKCLGHSLIPYNIRTNIIAPGWFPSEMTIPVQNMFKETNGVMPRPLVPAERMGNVDEMAGTIVYLASRAGGYCNGITMTIDGGFLANHTGP